MAASTTADSTASALRPRLLRALARWRRLRVALMLALPVVLVVATDLWLRADRLLAFSPKYVGSYAAAVVESGILWAIVLGCASARRGWARWFGAGAFVALATASIGSQLYFYGSYFTYLNLDATLFGASMYDSLGSQLGADGKNFAYALFPPLLVAVALASLGRKLVRTRRRVARLMALLILPAVVLALFLPCSYRSIQGSTPDVLYFHAIGGLVKQALGLEHRTHISPKRRTPPPLPEIQAAPSAARNVILVFSEAIPADIGCSAPVDRCPAMPFTNALLPGRMPLNQMRSNSSATAIELAVVWTGLAPNAGREPLHRAPAVFDFAHAAGIETAYWSSHHPLFANTRLYTQDLPTRFQVSATHLDPLADIDLGASDLLLTARVIEELPQLREPFFAMVHYGNTHVPFRIEPDDAPFQPALMSKATEDNEAYRNYFKNAAHAQDKTVAELLRFVRNLPLSERTVIIYTSDHGEQFREHGQLGHTGSVFDVEIRVPTWIDAPPASLTVAERDALASYADVPVFHTDMAPTLLDLLGLWDAGAVAPFREAMSGGSLLRPGRPETVQALTNCAGVWGCAFENYGVMRGFRKLHAREWDPSWLCYDLRADPEELEPLPLESCAELQREAERIYAHLPGKD